MMNNGNYALKGDGVSDMRYQRDDIDLAKIASLVWCAKWFIILVAFLFSACSIVYVLNLDNIYKSEVSIAPAGDNKDGVGLSGQLGGLAAIAGVNISGTKGVDKTTLALETLQSRDFISRFIERRKILVELIAVKGWDMSTNTLTIDSSLYDIDTESWVRAPIAPKASKPSNQEAYKIFIQNFGMIQDRDSGIITLTFKHQSPFLAKQLLDWLVDDINEEMKSKDIKEAERSIVYLEKQIMRTNISEVRGTLFSLIEEQTKTLMLANAREEYMFKVIDPAFVPEERFEPKRSLIVAIATFLGCIFGVFVVLLFPALRQGKTDKV